MFQSQLADLAEIRRSSVCWGTNQPIIGPETWWPADRTWLVHTDYDSSSTDVYGAAGLASALLQHHRLEAFEL